jgi:hypothetical protein
MDIYDQSNQGLMETLKGESVSLLFLILVHLVLFMKDKKG